MTQIKESEDFQDISPDELPAKGESSFEDYPRDAEKINGRWAMLGLVALLGAYITTGQIIPGIY